MSKQPRTLDIDEDIHFQRKEWTFQRIGVAMLFLIVLAALLGLTGMGGPASHAEAGERDGPLFVEIRKLVARLGQDPLGRGRWVLPRGPAVRCRSALASSQQL